jgi:drug/metabolite transporter (DMT)-like permease
MSNIPWWGYVIGAGLAWGTYVPIVFFGGQMLTPPDKGGIGGRLASILCVGVAYFLLAVVIPLVLMATRDDAKPDWKLVGLVFSGLAGVAGAVGAICVIFASKAAVDQAKLEGVNPATYRIYIAPLIFCLAPLINTLLSTVWHPDAKSGNWAVFHLDVPGWKLWIGIVLVAVGTFLVLMSKEEAESKKAPAAKPAPVVQPEAGIRGG